MSFEGMGQSIQTVEASIHSSTPPAHRLDELPAGYSLTVCSPAWPASALPAGVDYAAALVRERDLLEMKTQNA